MVLERLGRGGIDPAATTVLVACGTHPAAPAAELADLIGPPPPRGVRLRQHDCRDTGQLVEVGRLATGQAVRLHRAAVEADVLVTVGAVSHH